MNLAARINYSLTLVGTSRPHAKVGEKYVTIRFVIIIIHSGRIYYTELLTPLDENESTQRQ